MKFSPVLVFWDDSCFDEGWRDVSNPDNYVGFKRVTSIGFFLREDADSLYMCMSKDNDDMGTDILTIPKRMITSRVYLMEPCNVQKM